MTGHQPPDSSNAVLIFLDDSEKEIDAITGSFLAAFTQQAAPIIVSASLIDNIHSAKIPDEKNMVVLFKTMQQLARKGDLTAGQKELLKSILVFTVNFDNESNQKWIIKKISEYLYLFVPNNYLRTKNITPELIQTSSSQQAITQAERMLGLKVNHLETATVNSIRKPAQTPALADYFVSSLDSIFVTRKEYGPQASIPALAFFIHGHGQTDFAICGVSLADFTSFLSFLEKLQTRLLTYLSCYAAGANINLIYQDARAGAQVIHSFPIIVIALTDAYTLFPGLTIERDQDIVQPYSKANYNCFVREVTQSDQINYSDAVRCLQPVLLEANIPHIRYPGLPWFSILDYDTVASIGGVMAKSRTAPLDIAKFFAKQGKPSAPHALLLYARDIPFELIINTKMPAAPEVIEPNPSPQEPGSCYVPIFVSMIPGAVVHFIKKISSSCNTAHNILANFYIDGLWYRKLFIIDEITAPFSARMSKALQDETEMLGTLTNVLIDVAPKTYTKYFTYKGKVYISHGYAEESNDDSDEEIMPVRATDEQIVTYSSILTKNSKQTVLAKAQQRSPETVTPEAVSAIQAAQERKIATLQAPIPVSVAQGALAKQATVAKRLRKRNRHSTKTTRKKTSAKIYCKSKRSHRHS